MDTIDGVTWMTRQEAAEAARVNPRTIDRWATEGRITRYRADGMQSVRFRRDEIDAMFQPDTEPVDPDPFAD